MKSYSVLTLLAALQSLASLDICKYNHNGWSFCLLLLLVPHGSLGPRIQTMRIVKQIVIIYMMLYSS